MPFANKDTHRRRKLIFDLIDEGLSTGEVNDKLKDQNHHPLDKSEESVWFQFLHPVSKRDEIIYRGVVADGKDLAWVGRTLKHRHNKQTIS